jgi:hypothetical protein
MLPGTRITDGMPKYICSRMRAESSVPVRFFIFLKKSNFASVHKTAVKLAICKELCF